MGGISITQLLIIAAIVVLLFGTKKLRTLGSDLGASIKGFKKAMSDDEQQITPAVKQNDADFSPKSIEEQQAASVQSEEKTKENQQG
jgi:sec-independent protein translocase protein TatA